MDDTSDRPLAAPLVVIAGWLVPGLGYFVIGERARGLIVGITILMTFAGGMLIGGIRVIDVPGYTPQGEPKMLRIINGAPHQVMWSLRANPMNEIFNKPWYIAQTLTGPVNALATWGSIEAGEAGRRQSTSRIFDIGTLYTAVAGMLNLLVIIDAAYRATLPRHADGTAE